MADLAARKRVAAACSVFGVLLLAATVAAVVLRPARVARLPHPEYLLAGCLFAGLLVPIAGMIYYGVVKGRRKRDRLWEGLAEDLDADEESYPVETTIDGSTVTLHRLEEWVGRRNTDYVYRLQAPTGDASTYLDVQAETLATEAWDAAGAEDIQLGDDAVDPEVDVRSNDPDRARSVLAEVPDEWEHPDGTAFRRFVVEEGTVAYEWRYAGHYERPSGPALEQAARLVATVARELSDRAGRLATHADREPPSLGRRGRRAGLSGALTVLAGLVAYATATRALGLPPGTGAATAVLAGSAWLGPWQLLSIRYAVPSRPGDVSRGWEWPWLAGAASWTVAFLYGMEAIGVRVGGGELADLGLFLAAWISVIPVWFLLRQLQRVRRGSLLR